MLRGFDSYKSTAGDIMRGERATLNMSLEEVSALLKIDQSILYEIENGILNTRRTTVLLNSLIRDYAKFLNLDPDNMQRLYWEEVTPENHQVHENIKKRETITNKLLKFFNYGGAIEK
jgi:cytoskeletal protein RodZ